MVDACLGHDLRIDQQQVTEGEETGRPGTNFRRDGGPPFGDLEKFVQKIRHDGIKNALSCFVLLEDSLFVLLDCRLSCTGETIVSARSHSLREMYVTVRLNIGLRASPVCDTRR